MGPLLLHSLTSLSPHFIASHNIDMTEPQIDPALLEDNTAMNPGRGTKRKTRNSGIQDQPSVGVGVGVGVGRSSNRLAGKASTSTTNHPTIGVGVGVGVGKGVKSKGKGKETELGDAEPARGEEENLIGSEYKLRGVSSSLS